MGKKIRKISLSSILAAAMVFALFPAAVAKAAANEKIEGKFSYLSGSGANSYETGRIVPFEYEDSYFDAAPDAYSHDLAKISLALSLAAYDCNELEWLLGEIGFGQIEPSDYYLRSNEDKTKTEPENIGVAVANKKIDGCTVIAAVIRGFGYGAEWAGNFNVGTEGDFHAGFYKACGIVTDEIDSYLQRHKISGEMKIWLTGYSRGGAAANLAAGEICEKQKFGDVYAYCFETPMGVKKSSGKYTGYSGIFNIINPNDAVAKVAMAEWGFCRYGRDIYLPSPENAGRYSELFEKMKAVYFAYRPHFQNEPDRIDAFMESKYFKGTLGAFIDKLLEIAAFAMDNETYAMQAQQKLMDSCAKAHGLDFDFMSLIASMPDVANYLFSNHLGEINAAMENSELIFFAHYPDLCLAWMYSLDGGELDGSFPFSGFRACDWPYEMILQIYRLVG
ncbi:MAG: hypothetical protein FWG34_10430 [Oscillospiraceae bacterium]|nr:hypothetical protein [Oscillospiraceae bacterium]